MMDAILESIIEGFSGENALQHVVIISVALILSFVLGLLFGRSRSKVNPELQSLHEQIALLQQSANQLDDQVATVHTLNEKIKLLESKNQSLRNDLSRTNERTDKSAMLETKVKSQEQVIASLRQEIEHLKRDRANLQPEAKVQETVEKPAKQVSVEQPQEQPVAKPKPELQKITDGDDLKKIEGVGPKIEQIMKNASLMTYQDVIDAGPEKISTILIAFGPQYKVHDPTTWPQQAQLAMDEKWEELYELQVKLKGGKKA